MARVSDLPTFDSSLPLAECVRLFSGWMDRWVLVPSASTTTASKQAIVVSANVGEGERGSGEGRGEAFPLLPCFFFFAAS